MYNNRINNILIKKSNKKLLIFAWLLSLIGLPIISQLILWLIVYLFFSMTFFLLPSVARIDAIEYFIFVSCFIFYLVIISKVGYWHGKQRNASKNYKWDYLPFTLIIIYMLVSWIVMLFISKGNISSDIFIDYLYFAHPLFAPLNFFLINTNNIMYFPYFIITTYYFFMFSSILGTKKTQSPLFLNKRPYLLLVILFIILSTTLTLQLKNRNSWLIDITSSDENILIKQTLDPNLYRPFSSFGRLTSLQGKAELIINENYPKIDGVISLYPIYASAVQAIYHSQSIEDSQLITNSVQVVKNEVAYQRLINNETNMVIARPPTESQIEQARQNNVELHATPIAKCALVFITNKDNPVRNVSVHQIRDIYSGKIINWREINGDNKPILAFQHPKDFVSQKVMETIVMQNQPMKEPLQRETKSSTGNVTYRIADYKNMTNSIGYVFRYYVTAINKRDDIHLLAVNGIEPTSENIRYNRYPFIMDINIVTANEPTANTKKLIDWFLSPQGQQLIEDVGYIPIHPTNPLNESNNEQDFYN